VILFGNSPENSIEKSKRTVKRKAGMRKIGNRPWELF
jgi:hypothetical protein